MACAIGISKRAANNQFVDLYNDIVFDISACHFVVWRTWRTLQHSGLVCFMIMQGGSLFQVILLKLNYWWTLAVKAWSKVGDHVRSEQLVGCSVDVVPPSTIASPPHPMRLDANVWIAENDITNF